MTDPAGAAGAAAALAPGDLAEIAARFGRRCAGRPAGRTRADRAVRRRGDRGQASHAASAVPVRADHAGVEQGSRADPARGLRAALRRPFRRGAGCRGRLAGLRRTARLVRRAPATSAAQAAQQHAAGLDDRADDVSTESREEVEGDDEPDREVDAPYLGTAAERLATKDFAELTDTELISVATLMRRITLSLPERRSRRQRTRPGGRRTRHASHAAAGAADRRRRVPADRPHAGAPAAAAGRAVRHLGLDGALRAGHDPAALLRRRRRWR